MCLLIIFLFLYTPDRPRFSLVQIVISPGLRPGEIELTVVVSWGVPLQAGHAVTVLGDARSSHHAGLKHTQNIKYCKKKPFKL